MGGFVDIHSHGGGGATFGDSVEASLTAAAAHRAHGTEAIVASLVSEPIPALCAKIGVLRHAHEADPGIVGVHLEGPFLAPERKGAHDPEALCTPTRAMCEDLIAAGEGFLKQITIAPELDGALDAIALFAQAGVVPAVGHTTAGFSLSREAFDAGARLVTHALNAMPGIVARDAGPVGAALADERVVMEIIADAIHMTPQLIALLMREAPGRVALVTDAMSAAAAPEGHYLLGGLPVTVADGRAVLTGTDTLAGSTLTLDHAVEVVVAAGVAREDAIAAARDVPARVLGIALP